MKLPPGFVPGVGVHRPTAYGGFGEKLLRQLGWKDGEGLGAERQGITAAIKVTKKDDNLGVGGREGFRTKDTEWWLQAYDNVAQSLATSAGTSDSDDSDEDTPESPNLKRNRDGTIASGTKEELRLAYELAKDPWGRFGGRNGKLARIRAQEAALAETKRRREGAAGPAAEGTEPPPAKKAKKAPSSSKQKPAEDISAPAKDSASEPKQAKTKEKKKKEKSVTKKLAAEDSEAPEQQKPVRRIIEVAVAADPQILAAEVKITPRTGWWGANRFISSGCLEGLNQQPRQTERKEFTEDSQADLYNQTQAAKNSGKQGLGVGKGKAVGHDWKGTRVVFEEEPAAVPEAAAEPADGPQDASAQQAEGKASGGIKWKKLCKGILQQAPGQKMKLSQLVSKVESALAPEARPDDVRSVLISKVGKSSSFIIKGRSVRLASDE